MTKRLRYALVALALALASVLSGAASPVTASSSVSAQPIWVFGDSIPAGTWLQAGESWPSQLDDYIGSGQQVRNLSIGGQAFAFGSNRADAYIKSTISATPVADRPTAILVSHGTNDLIQSQNDMYVTRQAMFDLNAWMNANASTVKTFFVSIPPLRSDAGYASTLSLRRTNLNDWARAQWNPYGQLLDVGDVLTAGPTYADPRFYVDPLHPNAVGSKEIGLAAFTLLDQKGIV